MTAIRAQTERKWQDRSVHRAEERHRRARKLRLRGPIQPVPAVYATADAAQGKRNFVQRADSGNLDIRRQATWGMPVRSVLMAFGLPMPKKPLNPADFLPDRHGGGVHHNPSSGGKSPNPGANAAALEARVAQLEAQLAALAKVLTISMSGQRVGLNAAEVVIRASGQIILDAPKVVNKSKV